MGISTDQWRVSIGLFDSATFRSTHLYCYISFFFVFLFKYLMQLSLYFHYLCYLLTSFYNECINNYQFFVILFMLLLEAFDIEQNPGPNNFTADLSILHLNIRSIRNKLDYIKDNFLDFGILCFSETHLDVQISNELLFLSDTFDEPYRKDRTNHGGGVMFYLNSQLIHVRRTDLEILCKESIWVEIKVNSLNYLLGLFYSPRTADVNFINNLNLNIEKENDFSKNIIIVGD